MWDLVSIWNKPCVVFLNGSSLWDHSPLCRQLCAAHDWTQHAESLQEEKEEQEKAVRGRDREGVLGGRWVYLHISLQRRKTHPDTPHWEEKKSGGRGGEE